MTGGNVMKCSLLLDEGGVWVSWWWWRGVKTPTRWLDAVSTCSSLCHSMWVSVCAEVRHIQNACGSVHLILHCCEIFFFFSYYHSSLSLTMAPVVTVERPAHMTWAAFYYIYYVLSLHSAFCACIFSNLILILIIIAILLSCTKPNTSPHTRIHTRIFIAQPFACVIITRDHLQPAGLWLVK